MTAPQSSATEAPTAPLYNMARFADMVCSDPRFSMSRHDDAWEIRTDSPTKPFLVPEVVTGAEYLDFTHKLYKRNWRPAPRLWSGAPSLSFEDISPMDACELLLRIPWYQRTLEERKVEEWAGAMHRKEWRTTHQGLAIDQQGMLYDGQHRLAAQVIVGITLRYSVARGIEGDTFNVVDRGKMRSSSYTFTAAGEKDAFNLSAALRLLWMWENHPIEKWKNRYPVSDDQLKTVLDRHPGIRHSVKRGKPIPRASARATTLIHYLATQACGSSEVPDQWYAQLGTGENFQRRDPGLVLRNYFLGGESIEKGTRQPVRGMQSAIQVMHLFATAWNNTCTGQQRSIAKAFGNYGVPTLKKPGPNHLFRFPVNDSGGTDVLS
ncbi:hypothetical protein OG349_16795 [Streptomyces sp. NBC_01317]|uniref:hypothetical protein n=1 Tax=Streptomyces sp. NBC_01317 TaxID=2903822 RepID=UPI002E10CCBF|nr:hypothetical protein OG349_16795 [Streptomyces sp. NBC_01317]